MKTIEAFIKEIEGSAALQDEFKAIKDMDALAAFLKKYDVEGTVEDFGKAIEGKSESEGEINDDTVETVAGGFRLTSENAEDVRKGANDQFRELKNKTFGWP